MKGFALRLVLKQRHKRTRLGPITNALTVRSSVKESVREGLKPAMRTSEWDTGISVRSGSDLIF